MLFTISISEKGAAERRETFDKNEIYVGNDPGNEVMLPKGDVSGWHARILARDGRFIVSDLRSRHGTYVNGRKIAEATIVREGDKICIGTCVLQLAVPKDRSRHAGQDADVGQREAALEAAREAVNRYRTLAKSRPDAFLPDLAASLQNLGMHLSNAGDHEPALEATREAVDTYRTLAKARPDAFLPDLATELNNLGVVLSDLGQREAALEATREAVDAFRSLAKARPDAFLPDLVTSLDNLGFDLSDLGQHEAALEATREATEMQRRLEVSPRPLGPTERGSA
jgi:tetratricopeptide (TPR) repeat protein